MPDPITLTYLTPYRLTFTGPIPRDTPLHTAMDLSSTFRSQPDIGPLSNDAATALTTIASGLTGKTITQEVVKVKEVVRPCNCPSLADLAPPSSSSSGMLQRIFTPQRVVGWSAVLGGGYIMHTTLKEGWRAKKEVEASGIKDFEEHDDKGRKWLMVLGGGMYVAGIVMLGIGVEGS